MEWNNLIHDSVITFKDEFYEDLTGDFYEGIVNEFADVLEF